MTVRMRRSPFFNSSHAAGPKGYLVYNNMLLATDFESPEADYRHLKSAVQLWDVGCERQIEISGTDAARLVQMSTPRDLSTIKPNQCLYIPTVDRDGFMTNDPVLLQLDEQRFWVSIADSDLMLYYKGLAAALQLDVSIHEPEVAPLGIQGPKADQLVERVFGASATDIGFFRYRRVDVNGTAMILARSGYSMQGGFELYFEGKAGAQQLWHQLLEAGADLDVRAGSPCQADRVEGGLLSYLSDITNDMTPFEAGLDRFCDIDRDTACLALPALRAKRNPQRKIRAIEITGDAPPPMTSFWQLSDRSGAPAGRLSSVARAYSFECNIGIGLVDRRCWDVGTELTVQTPDGDRSARILAGFPGRAH